MNWKLKQDIVPLVTFILFGFAAAYFWSVLPDRIPSHFNIRGTVDGYSSKTFLFLFDFGLLAFIYLLITFIPLLDPFKRKVEQRYNIFLVIRDILLAFILYVDLVTMISAAKAEFQSGMFGAGLGLLLIVLGNYLPRIPRNFFVGVRSPWTLASDVVWRKTHVLAGWLFVGCGVLIIILTFMKVNLALSLFITICPAALAAGIIYPFLLFKRLQREGKLPLPEL